MKKLLTLFCCCLFLNGFSQTMSLYTKDVLKKNREKFYKNLVNNSINKNLRQPLNADTEEDWMTAFYAIALINYKSAWADSKVDEAVKVFSTQSISFQRSLLDLLHANYPGKYTGIIRKQLASTEDAKTFAMAANYILQDKKEEDAVLLEYLVQQRMAADKENPLYQQLYYQLAIFSKKITTPSLSGFFDPGYLPGNTLLISLQRKNRNYPGLVLVRDAWGNFSKLNDSTYFSAPQLARSLSNMPGYISNGNTPEGIFRMDGFDVSRSSFIGPSVNIQLKMPFEDKASHFYKDSAKADSTWNKDDYKNLLPEAFRNYYPIYQTYYAGMAGRTEIIAHGTTVNPAYYTAQTFYPHTPTAGCLCTKEIWDESSGKLKTSDQYSLVETLRKAGGAKGYAIVINIDDKEAPVKLEEILPFLQGKN
ncbi:MAG: hypothetical protein WAT19_11200 [Ferruginibacter sp.]